MISNDTMVAPSPALLPRAARPTCRETPYAWRPEQARDFLLKEAAEVLGCGPVDLESRDGSIFAKERPDLNVSIEEVSARLRAKGVLVAGVGTFTR